jgi:hypothetical protein
MGSTHLPKPVYSVAEAAAILRVTDKRVRQLIAAGKEAPGNGKYLRTASDDYLRSLGIRVELLSIKTWIPASEIERFMGVPRR